MLHPLNAGYFPGTPFSDTKNNSPSNGYGNDIGNSSHDIYYKIIVTSSGQLTVSHCNSNFDTFVFVLDETGAIIASNDDTSLCGGWVQAAVKVNVDPGTYYVVSEGYSSYSGNINTYISLSPDGATLTNAIDVGGLGVDYTDTRNNSSQNVYLNNMGQVSHDIYYKFTLGAQQVVTISHCASSIDTYLHLLDASGSLIESNDDLGPLCGTLQASIRRTLPAGTYYAVSEGWNNTQGDITTTIGIEGRIYADLEPDRDSVAFSQLPYFGNNDYLQSHMDSITALYGTSSYDMQGDGPTTSAISESIFRIPIKPIYIHPSGTSRSGGPTDLELRNLMENLNGLFRNNNTYIQFYLACEPIHINNKDLMELNSDERSDLENAYRDPYAITVFFTESILGPEPPKTAFGVRVGRSIFLNRDVYRASSGVSVKREIFAHEMGHVFDLSHTFQYSGDNYGRCRREPVDRLREYNLITFCNSTRSRRMCESTGDGISDTPADIGDFSYTGCAFHNFTARDHFGDSYANPPAGSSSPDPTNLMTYINTTTCQSIFSYLQKGVMLTTIDNPLGYLYGMKSTWKSKKYEFDTFEPDNSRAMAQAIQMGVTQERNFNYQPGPDLNNLSSCDVDWVSFSCPTSGTFPVYTGTYRNSNITNTILYLYDANGAEIASNDDAPGGGVLSRITFQFIAGRTYFIKVVNKTPSQNGYYTLTLGCDLTSIPIQGPNHLCHSENATYTIPSGSLPANATIQWTTTGNLNISGSSTGQSVSIVSHSNNGYGEVRAIITASCSPQTTIGPFSVRVGNPSPPTGENMIYGFDQPSQPGGYQYYIPPYPAATHYTWSVSGPNGYVYTVQDGTNSCYVSMDTQGWYTLLVMVTTPCGDLWLDNQQLEVYVPSYNQYYSYSYSPNPANNELTVSYRKKPQDNGLKEKRVKKDFEIMLLNAKGKTVKTGKNLSDANEVSINTIDVPDGTYYLHIMDGKEVVKKQVIIKH